LKNFTVYVKESLTILDCDFNRDLLGNFFYKDLITPWDMMLAGDKFTIPTEHVTPIDHVGL